MISLVPFFRGSEGECFVRAGDEEMVFVTRMKGGRGDASMG